MEKEVGKKIKKTAEILLCLVGFFIPIIILINLALTMYAGSKIESATNEEITSVITIDVIANAFILCVILEIANYIGYMLLYGFGQLVDSVIEIERMTKLNKTNLKRVKNDETKFDEKTLKPIEVLEKVSFCSKCGRMITTEKCPYCRQ